MWAQATPRKYKYKSCTLALVMLKDMPGLTPPGGFSGHDEVSYTTIEATAREILARCISPVFGFGKSGARGSESLGFANPTGFDIIGTFSTCFFCAWSHSLWSLLI